MGDSSISGSVVCGGNDYIYEAGRELSDCNISPVHLLVGSSNTIPSVWVEQASPDLVGSGCAVYCSGFHITKTHQQKIVLGNLTKGRLVSRFFKNLYYNQNVRVVALLLAFVLLPYYSIKLYEKYYAVEEIGNPHESSRSYSAWYNIKLYPEIPGQLVAEDELPKVSSTEYQNATAGMRKICDEGAGCYYTITKVELTDGSTIYLSGKTNDGYGVDCILTDSLDFKSTDICPDTDNKTWGVQLISKAQR